MASDQDARGTTVDTASGAPPLVEAKITAPRLRLGFVDRPRITKALDAGVDVELTVIEAPAGYGKTTAVRQWSATQDAALVWVTLDAVDDDPNRMWWYVATAIDRIRPGLAGPALRRLGVAGGVIEHAVDEVMSAIGRYARPVILVLDDLHTVGDAECLAAIDHALLNVPENLRVIISTRVDPEIGLPRLRASRQLIELRANDLAFSTSEAHALLVDGLGIELSPDEVHGLVERTEGWPVALVLAGVWLRGLDDPAGAVSRFGGDQRFVADYLSTEVLAAFDEDHRAFLEHVAVLGQFTPELCDAVLDRSDSAERLDELEHAHLFVSSLERGDWFRIHPLFAEYATAHLEASDPGATSRIHLRAAIWLREQSRPFEAIAHAAAADEHELVAVLLAEEHASLIRTGAGRTLLRWARTLPDDVLIAHPEVAVSAAVSCVISNGGTMELRRYLGVIDRVLAAEEPGAGNGYVGSMARIARVLAVEGGVERATADGRLAVELTEAGLDELVTGALGTYARAAYFAGDLNEARGMALRALEHPEITRRTPSLIHALATLALVAVEEGRPSSARTHAEQAKEAVGHLGSSRSWIGANVSVAMGVVLTAEGDVATAERELATAERFFRDDVPTIHHTWLLVLLARVRTRRGRLDRATEALHLARDALAELPDAGIVPGLADEVERELVAATERAEADDAVEAPSGAELAVLRLIAEDLSIREISEHLFVSENTVRSHRRALYKKLGVHSRDEAIARAEALDLLDGAESPG